MKNHRHQEPSVDSVVVSALEKVQHDFPAASLLPVEAHLTLVRANAVYSEVLSQSYEEVGLSTSRFNLMWLLYRSEGKRLSIGGLADNIGIKAPSVMKMVQALESEGWLQTRKDTVDRRVTFAELSEDGSSRFAGVLQEMQARWEDMWRDLSSDEQETLVGLLSKLRSSLIGRYLGGTGLAAFRARRHGQAATDGDGSQA